MKPIWISLFALAFFCPLNLHAHELRAEAGIFSTGYNKFAIPNPSGTRVTLANSATDFYYRGSALFQVSERGYIRLLAAPLEANYSFVPPSTFTFNNVNFPAGAATEVQYQFNSYRAGYLYRFPLANSLTAQVGGVVKVRVAKIGLRSGGVRSEYNNTGFVPLLNLGMMWNISTPWEIRLDVDGAAAKQGRAVDGSFEVFYRITKQGSGVSAGYRLLEGGADNEKVYTFALFRYAFLALTYGF